MKTTFTNGNGQSATNKLPAVILSNAANFTTSHLLELLSFAHANLPMLLVGLAYFGGFDAG